jgi:hypothetical protein
MPKYSKSASKKVGAAMRARKRGTLKSGKARKKVTSRKQAVAIGLSKARKSGARVPRKKTAARKASSRKSTTRKTSTRKSTRARR